ncbi:biotin carboxylase [Desulfocapsa sulfexigens DSM 10523]|uniref:biotin carboxylase n=1 Tax=Desulfocapsa sulfexigens (strain DSM 10523 / SB164P1) TaxID=1167006 RepID=M1PJ39_DESSD|nr:biotin carboxylase N-terminal domain-containing protein [Desulfocapsa sulfexigens]AGF79590.1 biotin carboxylase [Desulfocapsa sulfexigens DSM 10523]
MLLNGTSEAEQGKTVYLEKICEISSRLVIGINSIFVRKMNDKPLLSACENKLVEGKYLQEDFQYVLIWNRGVIASMVAEQAYEVGKKVIFVHDGKDARPDRSDGDLIFTAPYSATPEQKGRGDRPDITALDQLLLFLKNHNIPLDQIVLHPGYGFNSEDPVFFEALEKREIRFLGAGSKHIDFIGNKVNANKIAAQTSIKPPGSSGRIETVNQALTFFQLCHKDGIQKIVLKDAYGGGGSGQKLIAVDDPQAENIIVQTVNEWLDKGTTFSIDQWIEKSRHIEMQVMVDQGGNVRFGSPRDCTMQRAKQKIIEETASITLSQELQLRESIQDYFKMVEEKLEKPYVGLATFEMLYEPDTGNFNFLEVNTRIQVEHPVSGHQGGIQFIRTQFDIASGQRLHDQEKLDRRRDKVGGHTIEARICLEEVLETGMIQFVKEMLHKDALTLGVSGKVAIRLPERANSTFYFDNRIIRDREVANGQGRYDTMVGQVVSRGVDRKSAIFELEMAVKSLQIKGVSSNIELVATILDDPEFRDDRHSSRSSVVDRFMEKKIAEKDLLEENKKKRQIALNKFKDEPEQVGIADLVRVIDLPLAPCRTTVKNIIDFFTPPGSAFQAKSFEKRYFLVETSLVNRDLFRFLSCFQVTSADAYIASDIKLFAIPTCMENPFRLFWQYYTGENPFEVKQCLLRSQNLQFFCMKTNN